MRVAIEICCGSADDVIEAWHAGADRVELSSALAFGGITPSIGQLVTAKRLAKLPVMAMIRPREGGFCYSASEFACAVEDAERLSDNGADGLVFGFLNKDGTLDARRTETLARVAQAAGIDAVFHRAIDVVPDWKSSLDVLFSLGITRVLTSGQAACAAIGAKTICEMREYARGRLEIMAGGGIRADNIIAVRNSTGCSALHMSAHSELADASSAGNKSVRFNAVPGLDEALFKRVDPEKVRQIMEIINED